MWKFGKQFLQLKKIFPSNQYKKKDRFEYINLFKLNWKNLFLKMNNQEQKGVQTYLNNEKRIVETSYIETSGCLLSVVNQVYSLNNQVNDFRRTRYHSLQNQYTKSENGLISSLRVGNIIQLIRNQKTIDGSLKNYYPRDFEANLLSKESCCNKKKFDYLSINSLEKESFSFFNKGQFLNMNNQNINPIKLGSINEVIKNNEQKKNNVYYVLCDSYKKPNFSFGESLLASVKTNEVLKGIWRTYQQSNTSKEKLISEKQVQLLQQSLSSVVKMSSQKQAENSNNLQVNKLIENLNITVTQKQAIPNSIKDEVVSVLLSALEEIS